MNKMNFNQNPEEFKKVTVDIEGTPIKIESAKEPVAKRLVKPHSKKSRSVTETDVNRVVEESVVLYELCFTPVGLYKGAFAVHHSQIDDKDPLNFFVSADKRIIINPTITRHSNYLVDSKEACLTFPEKEQIVVPRWQKCEIDYVTIMVDPKDNKKFKLSSVIKEKLNGPSAFIIQHEVNRGNGTYIY